MDDNELDEPLSFEQVWLMFRETDKKFRKTDKKMKEAKTFLPEYKNKIVYGVIAFLTADAGSDRMAENNGLFVIKATGKSASIVNAPGFSPRAF